MTEEKTPSVFISHSSKDAEFARKLAAGLKNAGIETWLDDYELHIAEDIYEYIGNAILKASHFAIVLSQNSLSSDWVKKEMHAALALEAERKTIVVPILIDDVDIPLFLKAKLYADFRAGKDFAESFDKLLRSINKDFGIPIGAGTVKLYPDRFLPDLRFFVGRADLLKDIRKTLDTDHRAVLHDISGLGKTFTSYKYAYENLKGYDRIFLVRATKEEWLESLAKNGEAIDPALAKLTEQEAKAKGFRDWLEGNKNWLVIYDNVDLPEQLSEFMPVTENGDCLVTSNYAEAIMLGTQVGIEKMRGEEAAMLLYSRSVGDPRAVPDLKGKEHEAFDQLLEEIDGLPVTLTSTGAVIFKKQWSFERFWSEYNKTPSIAWDSEDPYSKYQNRSAGRIFSLIYDELTKDRKVGKAVKIVLDSISFISPDEIPEDLLQKILEEQYPPYIETEDPDALLDEVREKLTSYDLLKYDRAKKTFTTHRAIQRVIQSRLKGSEKGICISLPVALRGLFPLYDYSNREECEKYYQHVLVLVENADRFGAETDDTNDLYFMLGRYQRLMGNYALAERFHLRAAEISAAVSGAESETHSRDLNDLAIAYSEQGRYNDAIETYQEALRISEKTIGQEHLEYASRLNNLANSYRWQGRYDEAIEKYEAALRIGEKTVGREHPYYSGCLNNLAAVYFSQGRYDEAIEKLEEALRIDENTIGHEHPDYARRLNNLAGVYQVTGELDRAESLYERARQIREKTLGRFHPDTAVTYWWIGVHRSERQRYSEALPMFEEAYRQFVHFLGEDHPDTKNLKIHLQNCREELRKS